jgi:hypothetical protein
MLLARYRHGYCVKLAPDPVYYDLENGLAMRDIVGWVIWYSDGARYCSLDAGPENLPPTDAQCLLVYYRRDWGARSNPFSRMAYTRERYPIPNSDVVIRGDWTDLANHNEITARACAEWWPPPGTE